jgi:hypothetical protein
VIGQVSLGVPEVATWAEKARVEEALRTGHRDTLLRKRSEAEFGGAIVGRCLRRPSSGWCAVVKPKQAG